MKQGALHRFSHSAMKGGFSAVMIPLAGMAAVYLLSLVLKISGAYIVCRYFCGIIPMLLFCGAGFIIRTAAVILTAGHRCMILRSCVLRIEIPCGYERSIRHGLLRLYFLRGCIRAVMRLSAAAVVLAGAWVILCADFSGDGVYRLLAGFQAVPLLAALVFFRIRLEICFAGAEVITVKSPEKGAWKSLRESCRMLSGQYGFIAAMLLRNILCMLVPFFLPVFIQTLVSYFSVRHIEWSYNSNEQTCFHGRHKRTRKARRLSQE